jgi:PAS domain S-box-containing protein
VHSPEESEAVLAELAGVFLQRAAEDKSSLNSGVNRPNLDAKYRTLVEQIPAVVFMVYLDQGSGEAYVSPQIEAILGFAREEWLEDPIRWYSRIHPEDKSRWSSEAAEMFLTGNPLRSVYRVVARDGHVVSFHCEAKMVRRDDGQPWFIHGVAFDVTDLKVAEQALKDERIQSKRLENAVLEISGREQTRIGQDLHDGLGQLLTGIAFMSKVLEQKLTEKSLSEAAAAKKIVKLVNEAIHKTRELSRGLLPVLSDSSGLMSSLERLSAEVQDLFEVRCSFHCPEPVFVQDITMATHLYHIAQEGTNNALKHGHAGEITLSLVSAQGGLTLTIEDDGIGMPDTSSSTGMGMHIMNYRAKSIGATVEIQPGSTGGTRVTCYVPKLEANG